MGSSQRKKYVRGWTKCSRMVREWRLGTPFGLFQNPESPPSSPFFGRSTRRWLPSCRRNYAIFPPFDTGKPFSLLPERYIFLKNKSSGNGRFKLSIEFVVE